MPGHRPLYLDVLITSCKGLSYFCAFLHYALVKAGFCQAPVYIQKIIAKKIKILRSVWFARLLRRSTSILVRTPLRESVLKLINVNLPISREIGAIIVICHTPWKRILVQWCLRENFALVIGSGKWKDSKRQIQRQAKGMREIRELVCHLRSKGRVIVSADVFNNLHNCPVRFLGQPCNASLFIEKLAMLAQVPILVIIPTLSEKSITFIAGPSFSTHALQMKTGIITRQILSFFEKEIKNNPAILSDYVK
ncbi:MAG: hypothetical protein ABIR81_02250 [Ginsengibacter sp.]